MNSKRIFVSKVEDIPHGEHWAIIESRSINIPGDERSRQAPGHGYPESTEHVISYEAFTNEAAFKSELELALKADVQYNTLNKHRGIHVTGVYYGVTKIEVAEGK